jgi:hypothetical protein
MKVYKIKKGKFHSNMPKGLLWKPTRISFNFVLNTEELEESPLMEMNKLVGFSRGFHHRNSYRIGFYMNHKRELFFAHYLYNDWNKPYPKINYIDSKFKLDKAGPNGENNAVHIAGGVFYNGTHVLVGFGVTQGTHYEYYDGNIFWTLEKNLPPWGYKLGFNWNDNKPTKTEKRIIVNHLKFY